MRLKPNEIILIIVVGMIFITYTVALIYNYKTSKPIPDELTIFVRSAMVAAGLAITRLLMTVGKNDDD